MYFNCRSLLPKIDELTVLCFMNMPDVVCLVETWLCMDILDTNLSIPNYSIVRLDRNRHGGGVAMYIRNSVSYNVVLYGSAGLEVIVVSLSKCNFKLCVCVFYRPPSSPPAISNFVLLGDFNVNSHTSHSFYPYLFDLMTSFSLSQVVDTPTHFSPNGRSTLIDLVFVSNLLLFFFSNCSVVPQLSNSDHLGLMVTLKHQHMASISIPRRRVWRYKHADFDRANELLCDIGLDNIMNPYDIQMSWKRFKSTFLDVMEQCIPRSVLTARNNLPWLTKEIIQLIRKRNHHFRKAKCSGDRDDYLKFRQVRNRVVAELRLAKRRFFANLHPQNQREFWKIMKSLTPKENSYQLCLVETL